MVSRINLPRPVLKRQDLFYALCGEKDMKIIGEAEFRKQIRSDHSGAFLFFGEEDYLKVHALRLLKESIGIDPSFELFNYIKLDVLDYTPEKLIDSFSVPPMMAEEKLVVLSGLDVKKLRPSEIQELCDAISHLEEFDYNTFVLSIPTDCIDEGYLPNRPSPALTALSKYLSPVRFERSSPQKLAVWAMKHFEHYGIAVSSADCEYLVEYCGKSMFVLSGEIEKLSFYAAAHGRSTVTRNDITFVCCAAVEYDAFEFANAILANRRSDALETLSAMKFRQVEPLNIMSELSGIYCNLVLVKLMLGAGKSEKDISTALKMHEYKTGIYVRAAKGKELERLNTLVGMCCDADAAMKMSDRTYLPLEKLICSI